MLEPHNKDIIRELEEVVQALEINNNGKRVLVHRLDDTEVPVGKTCGSPLQVPEVNLVKKMDCVPVLSSVAPVAPMDSESYNEPEVTLNNEADCFSSPSTNLKPSPCTFSDRKRPQNTLKLSSQDYDKILHGKCLGFYHPRSMSFMRVRTLTPKTIQRGTPHEEISRTAEVPTSSPTSESFVQEEVKLVQEEVVFEVDKKTRLTSVSSCVSKVSLVQFSFNAARDHKELLRSARGVCRSRGKAKMGRSTACSKKRSYVHVSIALSCCRYTRSVNKVIGTKRKEDQYFVFDAHYHRPFKKFRVLASSTSFVSSVIQVASSFGGSLSPLFVL